MAEIIACHECDLLIDLPADFKQKQSYSCPRCQHKIANGHANPEDYTIALSLAALIALTIANFFPFMSMDAGGQVRSITLAQASTELFYGGYYLLAILIICFIMLLPAVYLILLLTLLVPLKFSIKREPPVLIGRFIGWLLPWTMAEVFLIGVLVSLIKLVSLAHITMGISFWAYVAFVIFFTYILGLVDKQKLWRWVWDRNLTLSQTGGYG
ncbi:paraquat-inducible protein A [Kangiella sp. TOML190]|uniref:paraquat-inducible protein A n=1 Tax=Kangiella sp. TOML190 TaxID=2931351 RepID=UPI0020420F81|nr:paraquat-inducible protein A [Kangiella sp. TOML190]